MSMHMITARTTEASSPATKAKHHNISGDTPHFSQRPHRLLSNGFSKKPKSIHTIPLCNPDKASSCEMPATAYFSRNYSSSSVL